jgi:hypothetical protein
MCECGIVGSQIREVVRAGVRGQGRRGQQLSLLQSQLSIRSSGALIRFPALKQREEAMP